MKQFIDTIAGFVKRIAVCACSVADFYIQGFRNMTVGRTLWVMIIIKVVILFAVFKLLFFPDLLKRDYDSDDARAQAVRTSRVGR